MGNEAIRETQVGDILLGAALQRVRQHLPPSWSDRKARRRGDRVLSFAGPGGQAATFLVVANMSSLPAGPLLALLRERSQVSDLPLLFVSDYIGPSLRDSLATAGISYVDATGWVRIVSDDPLVLISQRGSATSPRAGKPATVVRLNGIATSRIVRALCEVDVPLRVRDLAHVADVAPGSVSKLLPTLVAEGIVDRVGLGPITAVRRRALIRRWSRDYSFTRTNRRVEYFLAPRGFDHVLTRVGDSAVPVTMTGSVAARRLLPPGMTSVVPLRLVALYVSDPDSVSADLGLIPTERATANIVVAVPQDERVLTQEIAPVALVLADLLTLPGRADAEAEQLMDALARTDPAWEE